MSIRTIPPFGKIPRKRERLVRRSLTASYGLPFVPAPPLVGVELNPGPRRRRGKKVAIVVPVSASSAPARSRAPRARARRSAANAGAGVVQAYLRSAQNPFMYSPPTLGYQCFNTSAMDVGWSRNFGLGDKSAAIGSNSFAVVFSPQYTVATAGALGTVVQSYTKTLFGTESSPLSASASTNNNNYLGYPSDQSRLNSIMDTSRVVTAAVRVTVRYPMTSAPGRLFALPLLESDQQIAGLTYTQIAAMDDAKPLAFDGSGVASIQCNWRPVGAAAFDFRNQAIGDTGATITPKCLIVGIGWSPQSVSGTPGFTIDVESITHYEYQSGALTSSAADDMSSVSLFAPIERLAFMIRRQPSVLDKSAIMACQLDALRAAIGNSVRGRGGGAPPNVPSGIIIEEMESVASSGAGDVLSRLVPDPVSLGRGVAYGAAALNGYFNARNHLLLR